MSGTRIAANAFVLALVALVERAHGHLVHGLGESDHGDGRQDNQRHERADGETGENLARDGPPWWNGVLSPDRVDTTVSSCRSERFSFDPTIGSRVPPGSDALPA